ncbi:MAG: hypothetical protein P1P90_05415 [Patescibacteria group bacterium]|nr:hypothetical protein [Patescibacteria group bacterium]
MKYIYYIIFFAGIAMLAIAGVVWYLRRDNSNLSSFNPFQSQAKQEKVLYDPPTKLDPGEIVNNQPETDEVPTELIPTQLPPNLIK